MKKKIAFLNQNNRGQALLPVLIIMVIVLTLGVGVLHLSVGSILLSSYSQEGEMVLVTTEGVLESGLLRILRNPSYASESLQVDDILCTINASGQAPIVMLAECQSDRAIRRLQAEINFVQGEMTVDNIREVE